MQLQRRGGHKNGYPDEDWMMWTLFKYGGERCNDACKEIPDHWRCHIPYPPQCYRPFHAENPPWS